jgi:hypothetical protein
VKLVLSLVGFLAIAGCSAAPAAQPDVATLQTQSSTATATSTTQPPVTAEGRPRHRLDETNEENQRINQVWYDCMKQHGADLDQMPPSIEGAKTWMAGHKDASDACKSKQPLGPWSMDPENPEYKDNMHAWVECMKQGGMKVAESSDPETPWTYTESDQPANHDQVEQDCQRKVLGPKEK